MAVSYTHLDVYKRQLHEGVVARAMEKKGIISDRCELNRQIKADNALLRELRGQVKDVYKRQMSGCPATMTTPGIAIPS